MDRKMIKHINVIERKFISRYLAPYIEEPWQFYLHLKYYNYKILC